MKTKRALSIGVVAIATFAATTAFAGLVAPQPVDVDLTNRLAAGDMLSARYADNKVEYIGCGVRKRVTASGIVANGFCQAQDAKEEQFTCFTTNIDLLDVIEASGDYSYIVFTWNEDGECTRIGFSNQSFYLPPNVGSNL
ncbi:MAG: hypothetical protein R3C58_14390 [Parvularculaceae bacterium]